MPPLAAPWALSACLKSLLAPAYRSTDFEVHRHWLSLTFSLPPHQWYFDASSPWTLDYPPLFAWFERGLAWAGRAPEGLLRFPPPPHAHARDGGHMGGSSNLALVPDVAWHRASVMVTEALALGAAVLCYARTWPVHTRTSTESCLSDDKLMLAMALVAFDPNLIVLDHVHFQYNGFLLGVSLLAIAALRAERNFLGALLFALLLNLKHIFLYAAPLFTVYLFRRHCMGWPHRLTLARGVGNLVGLGVIVLSVFLASFCSVACYADSPHSLLDQLRQILSRLFPVEERGLLHAYWAPNAWALYAATDVGLSQLVRRHGWDFMGLVDPSAVTGNATRGLVQGAIQFSVLPNVPPIVTVLCTLLFMSRFLYVMWKFPHPNVFLHAYACVVMSSFVFGYHVHEKALAMVSVPLAFVALDSASDARLYLMLTWTTQTALAPLLFEPSLGLFKLTLVFCHAVWAVNALDAFHMQQRMESRTSFPGGLPAAFTWMDRFYLCGLAGVFAVYETGAVRWLGGPGAARLEFLPLMLMSVYTTLGVLQCWWGCAELLARRARSLKSNEASPVLRPHVSPSPPPPVVRLAGGDGGDDEGRS